MIMSCLTFSTLDVWLRNACSLSRHWQTHLPSGLTCQKLRHSSCILVHHWQTHLPDATSLHPSVVYRHGTGGSYVEKPAETLRLAYGQLAIQLERLTPAMEEMSLKWKDPWGQVFLQTNIYKACEKKNLNTFSRYYIQPVGLSMFQRQPSQMLHIKFEVNR